MNPSREEVILYIHRIHNAGWPTAKELGFSPRQWDESLRHNLPRIYPLTEAILRQRNQSCSQSHETPSTETPLE